jgi:hypothetical protein
MRLRWPWRRTNYPGMNEPEFRACLSVAGIPEAIASAIYARLREEGERAPLHPLQRIYSHLHIVDLL